MSLHFAIVTVVTALILTFVGWRGGAPERWGAAAVAARYIIDLIYHRVWAEAMFFEMDPGHAVMDTAMLVSFVWLTLVSNRLWPAWMAASALIAVLGHLMMLAGKEALGPAYWSMTNIPHFVQLLTLLVATIFHRWRLRAVGPYPDWS